VGSPKLLWLGKGMGSKSKLGIADSLIIPEVEEAVES
jgi:hypothetical protein